jgi:hypothetical protein
MRYELAERAASDLLRQVLRQSQTKAKLNTCTEVKVETHELSERRRARPLKRRGCFQGLGNFHFVAWVVMKTFGHNGGQFNEP